MFHVCLIEILRMSEKKTNEEIEKSKIQNVNVECAFLVFVGIRHIKLEMYIMTHYTRAKGNVKKRTKLFVAPFVLFGIKFQFAKEFPFEIRN